MRSDEGIFQNVPIRYEPVLRVVFVLCSKEMVGNIKIVLSNTNVHDASFQSIGNFIPQMTDIKGYDRQNHAIRGVRLILRCCKP